MSPSATFAMPSVQPRHTLEEFPLIRQEPSYVTLRKSLNELAVIPTAWNGTSNEESEADLKDAQQFLLSIISSDLAWLDEKDPENEKLDAQKDEIWKLASKRLAERCGRSAMPEMIRIWTIPSSPSLPELSFEIREPSLTGDNIGLKTWGTAFAIVKKLEEIGNLSLDSDDSDTSSHANIKSQRVLELGSGTGLVGIAAAAIWGASVTLTDLPEIKENLLFNIQRNASTVEAMGGQVLGDVLDWKDPKGFEDRDATQFNIIIAADPLYDDDHPRLVADNIKKYLRSHPDSRALTAIPMRDDHTRRMASEFRQLMQERGFALAHQGEEMCLDDWAGGVEEAVKSWWGVWKRN